MSAATAVRVPLAPASSNTRSEPVQIPSVAPQASYSVPMANVLTIEGQLPEHKYLRRPLVVVIRDDDGETLVSEMRFHMHAAAPTAQEALDAFKYTLVDYLNLLQSRQSTLGGRLLDQLDYLEDLIASER